MYAIYVYCLCICLGLLLRCSKSLRLTFQAMGVLQCRVCCGCLTLPGAHLRTPVFTPLIVFHAFYPCFTLLCFYKAVRTKLLGEGHGNPLQYSCLENPMDRGTWWATVRWVAKSCTQLKRLNTHACMDTITVNG